MMKRTISIPRSTTFNMLISAIVVLVMLTIYINKHQHKTPNNTNQRQRPEQKQKFIVYLPHSGLNNQRQAVENAMVVAHLTNRTLILPPLYMNHASVFPWSPFQKLQSAIIRYERDQHQLFTIPYTELFQLPANDLVQTISIQNFIQLTSTVNSQNSRLRVQVFEDWERYHHVMVDKLPSGASKLLIDNAYDWDGDEVMSHDTLLSNTVDDKNSSGGASAECHQFFVVNNSLCSNANSQQQSKLHLQTVSGWARDCGRRGVQFRSVNYYSRPASTSDSSTTFHGGHGFADCIPNGIAQRQRLHESIKPFHHHRHQLRQSVEGTVMDYSSTVQVTQLQRDKFMHVINLDVLRHQKQYVDMDVLVFGSMFGSLRLALITKHALAIHRQIYQQQLSLQIQDQKFQQGNEVLQKIVDRMVGQIGTQDFVAAHLRGGDGKFKRMFNQTVQKFCGQLRQMYDVDGVAQRHWPIYIASDSKLSSSSSVYDCVREVNGGDSGGRIYNIADFDIKDLKLMSQSRQRALKSDVNNSSVNQWTGTMTALFDHLQMNVSDSSRAKNGGSSQQVDEADAHMRNYDLSQYERLFIPMLEQMICARGRVFIGTKDSTFSAYIERQYRGLGGQYVKYVQ